MASVFPGVVTLHNGYINDCHGEDYHTILHLSPTRKRQREKGKEWLEGAFAFFLFPGSFPSLMTMKTTGWWRSTFLFFIVSFLPRFLHLAHQERGEREKRERFADVVFIFAFLSLHYDYQKVLPCNDYQYTFPHLAYTKTRMETEEKEKGWSEEYGWRSTFRRISVFPKLR